MDNDFVRELQKLQAEGQYLQIVQRLYPYAYDKLPAGVPAPLVIEALLRTFHASSDKVEIEQATSLMFHLKTRKLVSRSDLDTIFNAIGEAMLNAKGEVPSYLDLGLIGSHDESAPQNLIGLYARAKTREAKYLLGRWISLFYKEKGLLVLVDNLYSQQILASDRIGAILKKHSLLADLSLEPDECEAIVSAVLDFLEIPGPTIENSDDETRFEVDTVNRTTAARILAVLNGYPGTPIGSRVRIESKGDLIVNYYCGDRMYDYFMDARLRQYLSGEIH